MEKNTTTLQELATFMRNAAYSDDQSHKIDWSLRVVHPSTNDGVVGFSGGLWKRKCDIRDITWASISFSFDEVKGIHNFQRWNDEGEIRSTFGENPSFDEFKVVVIKAFGIKKLYREV